MCETNNQLSSFSVYVDDNFYYMDEDERYLFGNYESCEEAKQVCGKIVDDFLRTEYRPGMSGMSLYNQYIIFGEDPWIPGCSFSAWDYAKYRCKRLCGFWKVKGDLLWDADYRKEKQEEGIRAKRKALYSIEHQVRSKKFFDELNNWKEKKFADNLKTFSKIIVLLLAGSILGAFLQLFML